MNGAQIILELLHLEGVRHIFMIPGAHVDPLVCALLEDKRFTPVVCAHELGAAFAADGYARMSERPAICISIGGPGAANFISSAITAKADNVPVLYLTGDVPSVVSSWNGFQASDPANANIVALFQEAIGHSCLIDDVDSIPHHFKCAFDRFRLALPNPAHLSIPYDVLGKGSRITRSSIGSEYSKCIAPYAAQKCVPTLIPEGLQHARKIAILAGREANNERCAHRLKQFCEQFKLPVATTLDAKGLLCDCETNIGNFGYAGNARATQALLDEDLDVLLFLGIKFNERTTLAWNETLLSKSRILLNCSSSHANIPPAFSERIHHLDNSCAETVQNLQSYFQSHPVGETAAIEQRNHWLNCLDQTRLAPVCPLNDRNEPSISLPRLLRSLINGLSPDTVLCLDSGEHRLFAGHYWQANHRQALLTAATTAPMGWAIAAAIGAKLSGTSYPVCVLTGDGCMLMHGLELATAAKYQVPIIIIVSNNGTYGRIESRFNKEELSGYQQFTRLARIDWCEFASSLGIRSIRARQETELNEALLIAREDESPILIEVMTAVATPSPLPMSDFTSCNMDFINQLAINTENNE